MKKFWIVLLLCAIVWGTVIGAEKYTYIDLIHKLTDLEGLAVLPSPGEKTVQWSSYDRASKYDAESDRYINWDANGDGQGIIRKEGDSLVIAEMDGPGCIWRIWSAAPSSGHVKIYLDVASEPAIDMPFSDYFNLKNPPFVYPSLVHIKGSGQNSYIPIPYQKSCKIVAEKDWGNYYHFTYTLYPEGTILPTFKRELTPEEKTALESVDKFLSSNLGTDPAGKRQGEITEKKSIDITAGETVKVAEINGEYAITAIRVKLNISDIELKKNENDLLRELALRITWDGEKEPSVWTPLGDFFGTAPGINKYRSLPLGITDDGFYSYWYMPFEKNALVELVNDGKSATSLEFSITYAPLSRPIKEFGRFHARWHRDAFLTKEPERWLDWTILKTQGQGRFCGVMLHIWNPRGGWWGEGDEKFFIDGEKFPSTFGTGSEDYFGYAWGDPTLFQNAYHNQTFNSWNNKGHVSVNRWQISDNVPFHKSFEGIIEKYFHNIWPTLYACTTYWYLSPDGEDPYKPVPLKERKDYYVKVEVFTVKGALEGEKLKVLEKTGGNVQIQEMQSFGDRWSRDAHLWWTGAMIGDRLDLEVPINKYGKYELKTQLTKANDFGIVQLFLNNKKLGAPIDLYNHSVVPTGEFSLGTFDFMKSKHKLTVEIIGANEKATKSYMFGLDYLKLEEINENE